MTEMRKFAVPLPDRMKGLAVDRRGFPVPRFVTWFENGRPAPYGCGEPDFRMIHPERIAHCVKYKACWICGGPMGANKAFVIGPMCAINRTISEPPSHLDCARFAARVCPFLAQPKMVRNYRDLPEHQGMPGQGLTRNPGVACVWVTRSYEPFRVRADTEMRAGVLFRLGEPTLVEWWAEGREATQAEVTASISSGFPALQETAARQGMDSLRELARYVQRAIPLLPAA